MNRVLDAKGFDGIWEMDTERSKIWSYETDQWVPEPWLSQTISMQHFGNVMAYTHKNESQPGIFAYMGYQCAYDQADWVPYVLDRVEGDLSTPEGQNTWIEINGFKPGLAVGLVKQIYIDERSHYRLSLDMNGVMNYTMLRRLSEDGSRMVSHVYDPEGHPMIQKHFKKVSAVA
ncbi:hypothetical protein V6U71_04920 [Sphingopyxis sp. J-6]|uniref:hypothetical protein n=1 Tax=Sphingopyxis sp. J-6 TaxID=3122054 RepID=UPI0039845219